MKFLIRQDTRRKGKYRVQPNGKPLTIRLAAMTGNSTQRANHSKLHPTMEEVRLEC